VPTNDFSHIRSPFVRMALAIHPAQISVRHLIRPIQITERHIQAASYEDRAPAPLTNFRAEQIEKAKQKLRQDLPDEAQTHLARAWGATS
jgi:hypothetical protein